VSLTRTVSPAKREKTSSSIAPSKEIQKTVAMTGGHRTFGPCEEKGIRTIGEAVVRGRKPRHVFDELEKKKELKARRNGTRELIV